MIAVTGALEIAVHGWDISVACGARRPVPPGLAAILMPFQVEYQTDVPNEQVGLEQVLYDCYPEAQITNGGLNRYRPMSPSNPMLSVYMQAAQDFLAGG